jgi:hypothetical protein
LKRCLDAFRVSHALLSDPSSAICPAACFDLMIMMMSYAIGHGSGPRFNPAVAILERRGQMTQPTGAEPPGRDGSDAPIQAGLRVGQRRLLVRAWYTHPSSAWPTGGTFRSNKAFLDGPCRDRTCDLGIKSPLLYQLS